MTQRRPLGNRGHLHHTERNADARSEDERDDDPFVVDDAVTQQRATDGQHHADFAGENTVARGGGRTHPLQREDEERAGDQINDFEDVLASGKLGSHIRASSPVVWWGGWS